MKNTLLGITLALCASAISASAAAVCPTTGTTTSDCNFLITIGSSGAASISTVAGSSAFNGMLTFVDGTTDPGNDGSLVGVINNSSQSLAGFTLKGAGADAGIFDFSFNGICVYTNAAYCATAQSGYEGPTTTFSDLRSTVLFETTEGIVTFSPTLAPGSSTYFAIENIPPDINANGGLTVSDVTFASTTTAPEPATYGLLALSLGGIALTRRKLARNQ